VLHLVSRGVAADPQHYARLGDITTVARLCEADPTIAQRESVLMAAVDGGHRALVQWLLERGAKANARSDAQSRQTALHSAAWIGDLTTVKLLVEAGADRAARDEEHSATPRDWAATAIHVTNNPKCAQVVAYLDQLDAAPA
jgi:ankyrin repeat protein